ncbi:MAG: hypothetical protein PVG65_04595 [Candidatus Thorarchaeota archaeon]|jgi:hypothetical protein
MNYKELFDFCQQFRDDYCQENNFDFEDDLEGFCCEVSDMLHLALQEKNIHTRIIEGNCYGCFHHWLEYKNWIIDLTIKQFELEAEKRLPYIFIQLKNKCPQYTNKTEVCIYN